MGRAAQGGGGSTIPGGVEGTSERGAQCSALVDKAVIGQRLDPGILEIFYNINDSMILFYDFICFLKILFLVKIFYLFLHQCKYSWFFQIQCGLQISLRYCLFDILDIRYSVKQGCTIKPFRILHP